MVEKRFGSQAMPPVESSGDPSPTAEQISTSSAYLNAVAECAFRFEPAVMETVILFRQTSEGHILPLRTWQRAKPGGPNVKEQPKPPPN